MHHGMQVQGGLRKQNEKMRTKKSEHARRPAPPVRMSRAGTKWSGLDPTVYRHLFLSSVSSHNDLDKHFAIITYQILLHANSIQSFMLV
jgi:hypothetical protein